KLPVAGTGGAQPKPSAPAYDLNNQLINITDQLGELWIINGAGTPSVYAGPLMIGGGGCTTQHPPGRTHTGSGGSTQGDCTANGGSYGLPDEVIEDDEFQLLYAYTGNNGNTGASAAVYQMNHDLTGVVEAPIGIGSAGNTTTNVDIHWPTFEMAGIRINQPVRTSSSAEPLPRKTALRILVPTYTQSVLPTGPKWTTPPFRDCTVFQWPESRALRLPNSTTLTSIWVASRQIRMITTCLRAA